MFLIPHAIGVYGEILMKQIQFSLIAIAVVASLLSPFAVAQNNTYNNNYNEDRYDNNDNRYDNQNDGQYAYNNNQRNLYAQVIRVQRVNNRYAGYQHQECWNEQSNKFDNNYYRDANGRLYRTDNNGNVGGTVVGALVGGVVGNQIGDGKGQTAATIGGAVIGGIIGNNISRNDGYDRYTDNSNTVRRCRIVNNANVNSNYSRGYDVTYRYGNQTYHSFMNKNPGRNIRVAVNVQPIY
jgi:uncharacterized protein YcfJ